MGFLSPAMKEPVDPSDCPAIAPLANSPKKLAAYALFLVPLLTVFLAFCLRMLEWPCWQNPEYRLGNEMLLATHDAYHWLSGAVGYGRAVDHPMAQMLDITAWLFNISPAQAAFWLPPALASLAAGVVCLWGALGGNLAAGLAAGLIASIAPGFLGRTLLGYYDTDLITLLFPLAIALPLAWWCKLHLNASPSFFYVRLFRKKNTTCASCAQGLARASTDSYPKFWPWIFMLSGLLAWHGPAWHSIFPYLRHYNAFLLTAAILLLAPSCRKREALSLSLCWILPALAGLWGCVFPLLYAIFQACAENKQYIFKNGCARCLALIRNPITLALLFTFALILFIRGDILDTLLAQLNAYLKRGGDNLASQGSNLVFPSVAQSIIEVQDLSFTALFPYFHPWLEASLAGIAGFLYLLYKKPFFLFLLPLALLAFASAKLGGRMVMFGAPIAALGLALPASHLMCRFASRHIGANKCAWFACLALCLGLVAPFADMIPAMSQGPSINRRQAAALNAAAGLTPPDALLWIWWDWGYAAHYFARRSTIADGAEHGGPSLYLPAAVFASDSPRFARQVIRHTSACGNIPANVFKNMNGATAQSLMNRLHSTHFPLVEGRGRQFIIVSFEMLRLGFWISNFGNWNFISCTGEGGALSIVPQALEYRLGTGEVRLGDSPRIILPSSIAIFEETGVKQRNYVQEWFQEHPNATPVQQQNELNSRRNINFLFNRITDEKLAVDGRIYSSLMVQLLLCDPSDPRIAPYFRLVYDNVFARIFEVIPNENPAE